MIARGHVRHSIKTVIKNMKNSFGKMLDDFNFSSDSLLFSASSTMLKGYDNRVACVLWDRCYRNNNHELKHIKCLTIMKLKCNFNCCI